MTASYTLFRVRTDEKKGSRITAKTGRSLFSAVGKQELFAAELPARRGFFREEVPRCQYIIYYILYVLESKVKRTIEEGGKGKHSFYFT